MTQISDFDDLIEIGSAITVMMFIASEGDAILLSELLKAFPGMSGLVCAVLQISTETESSSLKRNNIDNRFDSISFDKIADKDDLDLRFFNLAIDENNRLINQSSKLATQTKTTIPHISSDNAHLLDKTLSQSLVVVFPEASDRYQAFFESFLPVDESWIILDKEYLKKTGVSMNEVENSSSKVIHALEQELNKVPPDKVDESLKINDRAFNNDGRTVEQIITHLRTKSGHDFSQYDRNMLLRRIQRRMDLADKATLEDYYQLLKNSSDETNSLFQDLLIRVTEFYRDPESFIKLKELVIPSLFEGKNSNDTIRVWIPGCSTGEEAYSIAILLEEYAGQLDNPPNYQIFASDIDYEALQIARDGCYPQSSVSNVSTERLINFFSTTEKMYCVNKNLKDHILFTKHNVLQDPPFTNLDLICCRNVLIYLDDEAQSELYGKFHFALNAERFLFLGKADSGIHAYSYFDALDTQIQILKQNPKEKSKVNFNTSKSQMGGSNPTVRWNRPVPLRSNIKEVHYEQLAKNFAPPSVIINENYDIIHSTGGIDRYLKFSEGHPSVNLFDVAPPTIRQLLRRLIQQAKTDPTTLPIKHATKLILDDRTSHVEISIFDVNDPGKEEQLFNIVFKPVANSLANAALATSELLVDENRLDIINALENELEFTEEQLEITVHEYEESTEQLRASNEELQSMNEQLQSTQIELQSINEELQSVNGELKSKINELNHVNSDLKNLMQATDIGTIFLDKDLRVQFFTDSVTEIFNLIPADKGRPIHHLTHHLDYGNLVDDILSVADQTTTLKRVLTDHSGQSYITRIRPYRTTEDKIDGIVLTFVNVTALKEAEQKIAQRAREQEALAKLGHFALKEHNLEAIINKSLYKLTSVLSPEYCMVLEMDPSRSSLEVIGSNIDFDESSSRIPFDPTAQWDIGIALKYNEPLIVSDYKSDVRISLMPILENYDISSGLLIAFGDSDETYGILALYSENKQRFTEHDVNFAQIVANTIGTAIERKRSENQLAEINGQLVREIDRSQQYQRQILKNDVIERWKVGAYLHDDLAQTLVYAKISLDDAIAKLKEQNIGMDEEWEQITDILERGIADVRNLSHEIVPIDVEEDGLTRAIQHLAKRANSVYKVNCEVEANPILESIENTELATNLYRVVQEGIKNAAIHGSAKNIKVSLNCTENIDYFSLIIEDDGLGLHEFKQNSEEMSINLMRHRMQVLGGILTIDSDEASDPYTNRISYQIPLDKLTK